MPRYTPANISDIDLDEVDGDRRWFRLEGEGRVLFRFGTLRQILFATLNVTKASRVAGYHIRTASHADHSNLVVYTSQADYQSGNWAVYTTTPEYEDDAR